MKPRFSPPVFKGGLHDARTATSIGRLLGPAFVVCFATGLISHFMQHPPGWLADSIPSRPAWGYRVTQGLHVASGIAAIPLLLAKLWTVYRSWGLSRSEPAQPHAPNGLGRTGPRRTRPRGGDTHPVRGPVPGGRFPALPGHVGTEKGRRRGPRPSLRRKEGSALPQLPLGVPQAPFPVSQIARSP